MLDPSPGEIADRLTILELKIEAAIQQNVDYSHFAFERQKLEYRFQTWLTHSDNYPVYARLRERLADINATLWNLEDEIRGIRDSLGVPAHETLDGPVGKRLMNVALSISTLNDQRAETVKEINKLFGVDAPEKMHAKHA